MKVFKMNRKFINQLSPGRYICISHPVSDLFIPKADNFDMTENELIEWAYGEPKKYILEVYETDS